MKIENREAAGTNFKIISYQAVVPVRITAVYQWIVKMM